MVDSIHNSEDLAKKLQDVIDGINHVLHPDAPVTKRDLVDIAHQIEGVIGEISKILTPGAKRGVITDVATKLQDVIDGINHVLHPDAPVTKRDLVDIAHQIEGEVKHVQSVSISRPAAVRQGRKGKVATGEVRSGSPAKVETKSPEQKLVADAESSTERTKSSAMKKVQPASQGSSSGRGRKRGIKVEVDENEGSSSEKRQNSNFSQASTVSISSSRSRRSEVRSSIGRRSEVTASPSLRAAPSNRHAVMFTGFISESDSALVRDLGGILTDEMSECTVLVADSMKRTVKLLCMLGRGVPVVGE